MLISLIAFIITISIVVVFHEWGHYLLARINGVHVEKFSLGFGRTLLSRVDSKGTEWALSMLPLGGYVKPLDIADPDHRFYKMGKSISEKSAFQKVIIYAAGPFFSFLLGIIIYFLIFMIGVKEPIAILGQPFEQSIAYKAGIRAGDKIVSIDGYDVNSWPQALEMLLGPATLGEETTLTLINSEGLAKKATFKFPVAKGSLEEYDVFGQAGLNLKLPKPKIIKIIKDSAAERYSLKEGDLILKADGVNIADSLQLIQTIKKSPNKEILLEVDRGGSDILIPVIPEMHEEKSGIKVGRLGAQLGGDYPSTLVRYGITDSIQKATNKTWNTATISLKLLGRMITGDLSIKNLSGPISIAQYSGQVVQTGFMNFMQFIALISISIGLLNLLPVPGLDGGQMLIHTVEAISGRELSEKFMKGVVTVGYALLLCMMFIAFRNDILKLINYF